LKKREEGPKISATCQLSPKETFVFHDWYTCLLSLSKKQLRALNCFLLGQLATAKCVVWFTLVFWVINSFNTEELPEPCILKYYHWTSFVQISHVKLMENSCKLILKGLFPSFSYCRLQEKRSIVLFLLMRHIFKAKELLSMDQSKLQLSRW